MDVSLWHDLCNCFRVSMRRAFLGFIFLFTFLQVGAWAQSSNQPRLTCEKMVFYLKFIHDLHYTQTPLQTNLMMVWQTIHAMDDHEDLFPEAVQNGFLEFFRLDINTFFKIFHRS